ncbi:MAG TPA: hypothetical protein VN517_17425, partial [Terriglobales bacterium]|nr:hypothetical protein [Terriglobales bacterium]
MSESSAVQLLAPIRLANHCLVGTAALGCPAAARRHKAWRRIACNSRLTCDKDPQLPNSPWNSTAETDSKRHNPSFVRLILVAFKKHARQ